MLEWTRSETLALASQRCTSCHGLGLRPGKAEQLQPCQCSLRAIFRICHARFRQCSLQEKYLSRVTMEYTGKGTRRMTWGRKCEEYCADFLIVSRRNLNAADYRLFRCHFLLGADWRLCCRQLGMERGNFFHSVYRIQSHLGRVFRELQPYALFPLDEYFSTHSLREFEPTPRVSQFPGRAERRRLSVPVRRAA
jgi:hypothetical protein